MRFGLATWRSRAASTVGLAWLTSLALAGCGGSDEPLTCKYVNSPEYCWQAAMEALEACMEPAVDGDYLVQGNLDEAALRCEGDDGRSVTFHAPVELESSAGLGSLTQYTLAKGDETCASISGSGTEESPLELTTSLGLLRFIRGSDSIRLECPDGAAYSTDVTTPPCWLSLPGHSGLQRGGAVIRAYLVRGPRVYRCAQARPD